MNGIASKVRVLAMQDVKMSIMLLQAVGRDASSEVRVTSSGSSVSVSVEMISSSVSVELVSLVVVTVIELASSVVRVLPALLPHEAEASQRV